MLKVLFRLLLIIIVTDFSFAQFNQNDLLFVGHAYGSHKDFDQEIKFFLKENMYKHEIVSTKTRHGMKIVKRLFDKIIKRPKNFIKNFLKAPDDSINFGNINEINYYSSS